ncbi:MAG: hypothetical protein JXA66_00360 [Oligoflexia bacterium]|nr:hypothetical protein [Oligoflexia bacterium]
MNTKVFSVLLFCFLTGYSCSSAGETETVKTEDGVNTENKKITTAPPRARKVPEKRQYTRGEYIAVLKNGENPDAAKKCLQPYGLTEFKRLSKRIYQANLGSGPGPEKLTAIAEQCEYIISLEPNYKVELVKPVKTGSDVIKVK